METLDLHIEIFSMYSSTPYRLWYKEAFHDFATPKQLYDFIKCIFHKDIEMKE